MLKLNTLTPLVKKRQRVGRGGSRGGTSGRGHKGLKARSGPGIRPSYEGGQMPLIRRLPKKGFNNAQFKTAYVVVGIDRLVHHFDDGATITKKALIEKGLVKADKSKQLLLKVLGGKKLAKRFTVEADAFSESARTAIQGSGGQATVVTQ